MNLIIVLHFQKSKSETNSQEEQSQFQESQVQRAKRIMKPFVLRRLKKDVLNNLPKKHQYTVGIQFKISILIYTKTFF